MRSADSPERYIYEGLCEGAFSIEKIKENEFPVWQHEIPKNDVYEDYVEWCKKSNEIVLSKELFGKILKKVIVSVEDTRPGGDVRVRCYKFPSLQQVRKDFSKAFKEKPERIFDDYEDL
jgi:phage/plasmid-associated DNA primase